MGREQELGLFLEPDLSPVVHTLGAVSVLTGVILIVGLVAILTDIDVATESLRTAVFDVPHSLEVRGEHTATELGTILLAIETEYIGKFWHESHLRDLASGY